jgi:hypothetical protein
VAVQARQPFQRTFGLPIGAGGFSLQQAIYTVPAERRLVIEHASLEVILIPGQKVTRAQLTTVTGGFAADHILVPTLVGTLFATDRLLASEELRAYADQGTQVVFEYNRSSNAEPASAVLSISGYLEPM